MNRIPVLALAVFGLCSIGSAIAQPGTPAATLVWTPDGFAEQLFTEPSGDADSPPAGQFRIVMTSAGNIRLLGTVTTPQDRRDVISAVKRFYGVYVIDDQFTVANPQP